MVATTVPMVRRGQPLRQSRSDRSLVLVIALFMAVVIAEAAVIALAAPTIADLAALYVTTT